jgi:transposase
MLKRRTYDREFKLNAVELATRGDKSLAQVARDLGINPNVLSTWESQLKQYPHFAFPGKGHLKPHEEEIRQLKKKLRDAEEERDILKKAIAIFSRDKLKYGIRKPIGRKPYWMEDIANQNRCSCAWISRLLNRDFSLLHP